MSSLVRRIEKRRLKGMGFFRNKLGFICNSNGDSTGSKRWPFQFTFPRLNKKLARKVH